MRPMMSLMGGSPESFEKAVQRLLELSNIATVSEDYPYQECGRRHLEEAESLRERDRWCTQAQFYADAVAWGKMADQHETLGHALLTPGAFREARERAQAKASEE
tara:strand:+ start:6447 stop:6761 length:315 start_codon:yes stop_codon:yes gene_type:complete